MLKGHDQGQIPRNITSNYWRLAQLLLTNRENWGLF